MAPLYYKEDGVSGVSRVSGVVEKNSIFCLVGEVPFLIWGAMKKLG